ncbi:T9SS type A sorting domain-containing protein [Rudanella paleaurantiibacter]|uniref:T9SS type A sorting domain-containing protein n=1 Tax=Rudanella paleaurantiibacter TaxID=2614655 RepID=A0A7J5U701_9BACT|nr:T9SS type A sorting domain-containing protein [Rudanella paleaurantiibacter]KAB7732930.1 T9SS type A sorting domain-containing protein [Rudanella paleaurantiibacter]
MKTTRSIYQRFWIPAVLIGLAVTPTLAQQSSKNKTAEGEDVTIKIIERNGDQVRETTRTYKLNSNDDRDQIAMKLVDSIKAARPNERNRQMTIIIDQIDGTRVRERPGDVYARRPYVSPNWQYNFRMNVDSLVTNTERFFRRDIEPELNRAFDGWSRTYNVRNKPSTIRGLSAYPNNPDKDQLNVRFTAPAKGDIQIVVTNAKGKEVARRELKDFSGEFVGQIDLGKKGSAGVYFLSVTQNEDGAVQRVVIE